MTDALRSTGVLDSGEVSSFGYTILGEGKGFTGQVARVDLEYTGYDSPPPASLIAKFPPADPEARRALHVYNIYEREAGFYNSVSNEVCLEVPKLYYSDVNAEQEESVLLLEDFRDAQPLDILSGLNVEEATFIAGQLAAFHASWWESPRLAELDWLWKWNHQAQNNQELLNSHYEIFKEKMGDLVSPEFIEIGDAVKPNVAWIMDELSQAPITFLHGDFHPNNMFLEPVPNGYELKVLDWQVCSQGCAMRDLMYFISSSLMPEDRMKHESAIIQTYHQKLIRCGVEGYSWEDCMRGYRLAVLDLFFFMVTVSVILDFTVNEEAVAVRDRIIIDRWGGIILDHRPLDLLPHS